MKIPLTLLSLIGASLTACSQDAQTEQKQKPLTFRGICDASASVPLGNEGFVVADDESNTLRVYKFGSSDPVKTFALDEDLEVVGMKDPETDLEGATRVGDTIYWITSHGRSKKGKWRDARFFFFATTVPDLNSEEPMAMKGRPYKRMIHSLDRLPDLDLKKSIGELGEDESKDFAPKETGLNIESLCATPDGKTLYLGFRNPQPKEHAILLPLENADEVLAGTGMAPKFGAPILLDMGGNGFRAMEYSEFHKCYLIVAGSHEGGGASILYKWKGGAEEKPEQVAVLAEFNPETIMVFPDKAEVLMLSDDGTMMVDAKPGESIDEIIGGQCECKSLVDPNKKSFRAYWLNVPL